MKTRTKLVVTSIAFTLGFAILQIIFGLIWQSQQVGLRLIPASLFAGCFYLLYFFVCSRRRDLLALLIFFGIGIIVAVILTLLKDQPVSSGDSSVPTIIRLVYFMVLSLVTNVQANPIHEAKVEAYENKKRIEFENSIK